MIAGRESLKIYLDELVDKYNQPHFIKEDPISIPKRYQVQQDIEISAFWIAILAWGNRKSILNSGQKLMQWMDNRPFDFIRHHTEADRKPFLKFVHRTFNAEDAIQFLEFFKNFYSENEFLEDAFCKDFHLDEEHVGPALIRFKKQFVHYSPSVTRSLKHISSPESRSRCKRLLMFLRWMVRKDESGVDFGIWKKIKASQLLMPLDVHVEKNARKLGLLQRKQLDWLAVLELSQNCKCLDPEDPVKYDFALFGLGVNEKIK